MRTYIFRFLPLVTLLSSFANANLAQPNDGPYYRLRWGRTLYVYDASTRPFIEDLASYNEAFREMYDRSFHWKLDEEQDLILLSPNTEDANAFATQVPNVKSVWFGSGAGVLDEFAGSSWMMVLSAHETSHLYQMNAKSQVGSLLKSVLGNALTFNAFVWPITLRPNELLSGSFVEGNAVLNESRVNRGGRLYNGDQRALALRMVAEGLVDATRLINEELRYPFGHTDYVLGMYFQAHLNGKYGIEKTNAFFRAQAEHWLNPLILSDTFRTHFGATFYQEVREFVRELERLAQQQKLTPGEALDDEMRMYGMNHDSERVWWLSTPGYRTSRLHVFDKRTREITTRTVDMLYSRGAKSFFIGEKLVTAESFQNDLHHKTMGLYAEHGRLEAEGRGEIVTDRRAGHRVGFDAKHNWRDPHVLLDGEPFDVAHSDPQLDPEGRVWHFRQNGPERLLYRDRQIVARVKGWYGKLTEIDADGTAYFVGATKFGSSLFSFKGGEISRVLDSDVVLDARRIDQSSFVVMETTGHGSRVLVAQANPHREDPEVYAYPFPSEDLRIAPALNAKDLARDEKPYSAFRELRFSTLDVGGLYSSYAGVATSIGATFADPLEFTQLSGGAAYSPKGTRRATAEYTYTRYLPQAYARYNYGDYSWKSFDGDRRTVDQQANLGARTHVLRRERWDGVVDGSLLFEREGADFESDRTRNNVGIFAVAGVSRKIPTELGLYPWRLLSASLTGRVVQDPSVPRSREHSGSFDVAFSHGFNQQFYVAGSGQVALADGTTIDVGGGTDLLPSTIGIRRLTSNPLMAARSGARVSLEGRKVFPALLYDNRIPLGLHRWAAVVIGQAMALERTGRGHPKSILEYGYGFDADLLIGHVGRFTLRALAIHTSDDSSGDSQDQLTIGAASAF